MTNKMTIEKAIELILQACDMTVAELQKNGHMMGSATLSQASNILRNMAEETVETSEICHYVCQCCECLKLYAWPNCRKPIAKKRCPHCEAFMYKNYEVVTANKISTETRVLKIQKKKIDVKFE